MRIIKLKYGVRKPADNNFVYCGREMPGFDESPLHNPFKIGVDGTRQEVLLKFRTHLAEQLEHNEEVQQAFENLTSNSVLGCWCCNKKDAGSGPHYCHCDIIAEFWKARHA